MTTAITSHPQLRSYACDAEHAALIAAHIQQLVDEAPPLPPRMEHLLRLDTETTPAADTAA
jgi:hypothetical protein